MLIPGLRASGLTLMFMLSGLFPVDAGAAKIQRYTDPQGTIHIDNTDPSGKEQPEKNLEPAKPDLPRSRRRPGRTVLPGPADEVRPAAPPALTPPQPEGVPTPPEPPPTSDPPQEE